MGKKIDFEGTFKFVIEDHGLDTTKKGFPQWVVQVKAIKMYDEVLCEWSETIEDEGPGGKPVEKVIADMNLTTTGYFILLTLEGEDMFHVDRITKAIGWDGHSFAALDAMELDGMEIIGGTKENIWNDKVSYPLDWVDHKDAPPIFQLKKMEADDLKALDAKFGRSKKAKPATAKPAAVKPAAKPATTKPKPAAKPSVGKPSVWELTEAEKKAQAKPTTTKPVTDVSREVTSVAPTPATDAAKPRTSPPGVKAGKPPETKDTASFVSKLDEEMTPEDLYEVCLKCGEAFSRDDAAVEKEWTDAAARLGTDVEFLLAKETIKNIEVF